MTESDGEPSDSVFQVRIKNRQHGTACFFVSEFLLCEYDNACGADKCCCSEEEGVGGGGVIAAVRVDGGKRGRNCD